MQWPDLVLLGVMVLSALIAFSRGFVREVLSVGAWIGAAAVALTFHTAVNPLLSPYMPSPNGPTRRVTSCCSWSP